MSNPGNDNRLEQLSRKAAGGYTPPGNASWEKMEAALDKVMPVEKKKRRPFIFWWLFTSVIIGAGLVYFVWPDPAMIPSTQTSAITASSSPLVVTPEKSTAGVQGSTDTKKSLVTEKSDTNNHLIRNSATTNILSKINKQAAIVRTNHQQQLMTPLNIERIAPTAETPQKLTNEVTKVNANTATPTPVYTIQPGADTGNSKMMNSIIEKTDTITSRQPILNDSLHTDTTMSTIKKSTVRKFSLAFVGGIDASTVKYKYTSKAGINIGILAGYHFNDNLSIHTGVLYTKKNYTVAGEDFYAPKNSWVANYKLTMVEGFCNMWEMPLFFRYQFNSTSKRNFFLGSGISSYIMTRENYNYSYYWNGQPVTRNSNYPNGNTHLFSILRLSGGWRKSVGAGSSVLVEPYAALPLAGVGFGSIRLSSFGLNFSLQIRQPSQKK